MKIQRRSCVKGEASECRDNIAGEPDTGKIIRGQMLIFTLIRVVPPRHSVPIVGMSVPAIFYISGKCSFPICKNDVSLFGEK